MVARYTLQQIFSAIVQVIQDENEPKNVFDLILNTVKVVR